MATTFSPSGLQAQGGPIREIRPGDVVTIPADVKHWHGAAPATAISHIAIQEKRDGSVVTWLEEVSDEQYGNNSSAERSLNQSSP